jgi:hypothetical protein
MEYNTGQAVIYWGKRIAFFYDKYDPHYGYTLQELNGKLTFFQSIDRPATEAEILAEIQKHGWEENEIFFSPTGVISIGIENGIWTYQFEYLENIKDLTVFGNECIQASCIITALNLVNV